MEYLKNIVENVVSSKIYTMVYIGLLFFNLIQGRFCSIYVTKYINKIMSTRYQIVEDIKKILIEELEVKEIYIEYYDCYIKSWTYFILFFVSIIQLIGLFIFEGRDTISINVCLLTSVIALMECRDNKRVFKRMGKEIDIKIEKLITDFSEINEIEIKDAIKNSNFD
ncbi:TPA: hypothetical protein ACG3QX_003468 [Clostridioides difficile]